LAPIVVFCKSLASQMLLNKGQKGKKSLGSIQPTGLLNGYGATTGRLWTFPLDPSRSIWLTSELQQTPM
jgi:hypothetical protein